MDKGIENRKMIPENIMLPVMEFIRRAHEIPNLQGAVLFGSAVKGEMSKKSDIDMLLLFDTDHNPEVGKEMKSILRVAGEIEKKYNLAHSFSFVTKNINETEDVDLDFLWEVSKEGIIIWGNPDLIILKGKPPSLKAMMLIKYSTKKLNSAQKSRINRSFFGYKYEIHKKKVYKGFKEGTLRKEYRLAPSVLLVPAKLGDGVIKILKENGAEYETTKLWV